MAPAGSVAPDGAVALDLTDADLVALRSDLRDTVRAVLVERSAPERVRALADDPLGFDPTLWATAAELGWTGLEIPEEHGGSGMGFRELAVVLDELGRALTPSPVLASVVLGTGAVLAAGDDAQRATWLPALAAGERRLTAALGGRTGGYDLDAIGVRAEGDGDGLRLTGTVAFVPDVAASDAVVVAVTGPAGPSLAIVPTTARGLTVVATPTYDQTRRLSEIAFDGVTVPPRDLLGPLGGAAEPIEWLLDRAATALALDAHGGARRVLEMSVDYAGQREQFGRPIGSFQAVKHRCAEMLLAVETARVAAETAARELPPGPGSRSAWPSIAKSHAGDAYAQVAGDGIRVHGGIGCTWEHELHLHVKRAKLDQAWFGTSAWHRDRIAQLLAEQDVAPA
jgi:alkylation response protein AidB-like acyl-CoA dehydrogenase